MTSRTFGALVLGVCLLASPASSFAGDDPLVDDIASFKADLLKKFDARQFTELEKIERELRAGKTRFAGGDWQLFHFYEVLRSGHVIEDAPIDSDYVTLIAGLTEWQEQSPASAVPPLLLADAYTSYAWFARGSGEKIREGAGGVFTDRLNRGAFYLNASRRLAADNPHWYTTALRIARGLGWPRDRADALVKDAAALEPLYPHAYGMMAIYLLPRWYGADGDWEQFAKDTADRIGGLEGSAVYNHIALRVANYHNDSKAFFEGNDVNWRKLQWSFADREKLYGSGIQPLNEMLRLCQGVDDKTTAHAFMKRVGDHWAQSVWRTRQAFDRYQEWLNAE